MNFRVKIILLSIFLFTKFSFSQIHEVDSLWQIFLNEVEKSNTDEKEQLVNNLLYAYPNVHEDTANLYINKLIAYSKENKFGYGLSTAYLAKSTQYYIAYDSDSFIYFKELALETAKKDNDLEFVMRLHLKLSSDYLALLDFKQANYHAEQLRLLTIQEKDWEFLGIAYNQIGYVKREMGDLTKAIEYSLLADSIFSVHNIDGYAVGNLYLELSHLFAEVSNYDKAEYYIQLTKENFTRNNRTHNLEKTKLVESEIKIALGKYNDAIIILKDSENYFRTREDMDFFLSWAHHLNGKAYLGLHEYDAAIPKFEEALEIHNFLKDTIAVLKDMYALGQTYYGKKDYQKSSNYIQNALVISKGIAEWPDNVAAYKLLADAAMETNEFKKANDYLNIHIHLKDSLDRATNIKNLNDLESKYQNKKKEDEIALLTLKNELSNKELQRKKAVQTRLIILILLLALVLSFLWYWMRSRRKVREIRFDLEMQSKNEMINGLQYRLDKIIDNQQRISEDNLVSMEELNVLIQFPLSEREYDVLVSVAKGNTNGEAAKNLFISENTVKFHLKNIYNKLDVSNRVQALNRVKK